MLSLYLIRPLVLAFVLFVPMSAQAIDVVITAASVIRSSGNVTTFDAGETILAGQALYVSSADGKVYKSECDVVGKKDLAGIALNSGAASQPIRIQSTGTITIGGTTVVGTIYCVSATGGGICPWADLATTNSVIIVGVGGATNTIIMNINVTGVAIP